MNLPSPGPVYSTENEREARATIEREDKKNQKIGQPVVLTSPDGKRWSLAVDNAGALSAVAVA